MWFYTFLPLPRPSPWPSVPLTCGRVKLSWVPSGSIFLEALELPAGHLLNYFCPCWPHFAPNLPQFMDSPDLVDRAFSTSTKCTLPTLQPLLMSLAIQPVRGPVGWLLCDRVISDKEGPGLGWAQWPDGVGWGLGGAYEDYSRDVVDLQRSSKGFCFVLVESYVSSSGNFYDFKPRRQHLK